MIVGAVVCAVATLQCSSNQQTNTPSSLKALYSESSIAALRGTGEIRVDGIASDRGGQSALQKFALDEYRLVQPGRVLSGEEAKRLRTLLLDPNSYSKERPQCEFDPQFAFALTEDDSIYYFITGNDCHLATMQTSHTREHVVFTEKAGTILGAFCEALFQ